MRVYIDESGNLGTKDRYFVITALVPHSEKFEKRIKNIVKRAHTKYCLSKGYSEIKASRLLFEQKQEMLTILAKNAEYTIHYIVVDKWHITKKLFQEKNVCYNYLTAQLIKKILKDCNENIHVIIDNHTTKVTSADSLSDYIKGRAFGDWGFKYDISINFMDSKMVKGLQAVDLLSNPIWAKYNHSKNHLFNIHTNHYKHQIKFPYQRFGL